MAFTMNQPTMIDIADFHGRIDCGGKQEMIDLGFTWIVLQVLWHVYPVSVRM